jgi:hypothetical protein
MNGTLYGVVDDQVSYTALRRQPSYTSDNIHTFNAPPAFFWWHLSRPCATKLCASHSSELAGQSRFVGTIG